MHLQSLAGLEGTVGSILKEQGLGEEGQVEEERKCDE